MKILKNPFSKQSISEKQRILVESLEGIGDILVYETKRQKNKIILEGLGNIKALIEKIFSIQENDIDKFERLVVSQDYFDLHKKDEREAKFRLSFDPDKYLISFSTAINQIVRIYDAAVDSQNEEISRFAVYHINWILAALSQKKNNNLFVEQLLKKLSVITRKAVERNDISMYSSAIHWYTDIVFNRLGGDTKDFNLDYLELFDKYFFSTIKYIVAEDQKRLFQSLVSSLVDGVDIYDYHRGEIWNYGHIILREDFPKYNKLNEQYNLEKQIRELSDSEGELHTKEAMEAWLAKFEELKIIVYSNLNHEQKIEADEIETNIRAYATSQFKHQNLLEIVFAVGSYCLFKKRYSYIKYLWEYKQPPDSDASWTGHDISPSTLDEVIIFYFRKGLFENKLDFWEGHHGSEKYHKQYFLLLLVRVMQNIPLDSEGACAQIDNYGLPDMQVTRLSDLQYSIDEFVPLAKEISESTAMIVEIGLNQSEADQTFNRKLVPFLKKLKEEAGNLINAKHKTGIISAEKVGEFKKDVLSTFYEVANTRDIFTKYLNAYINSTTIMITDKRERLGINVAADKAPFFEQWHINYASLGKNYGRDLASCESSCLLDDIANHCKEISKSDFENILSKFGNYEDIIIFATNIAFLRFFEESNNFKPKWHRDIKQIEVKSFGGWYEVNGNLIPVFKTQHQKVGMQILILNKTKIGKLIQLSPLDEGEHEESLEDVFYMDIQAYSENKNLMESLIKEPPEWLQKIGDEQKQREYLATRARVQIFERFEYQIPKDFEGYKLLLQEN